MDRVDFSVFSPPAVFALNPVCIKDNQTGPARLVFGAMLEVFIPDASAVVISDPSCTHGNEWASVTQGEREGN